MTNINDFLLLKENNDYLEMALQDASRFNTTLGSVFLFDFVGFWILTHVLLTSNSANTNIQKDSIQEVKFRTEGVLFW